MYINFCRKHPQGIPFTALYLSMCKECGRHEMEMEHKVSRAYFIPSNDMIIEQSNDLCWECFINT